jgi:hypothetical protein
VRQAALIAVTSLTKSDLADRRPVRPCRTNSQGDGRMGSVVKKRRKRMAKKKHRKLLRKTRVQRRRLGK